MRVLVTGGAGYIGSVVVEELLRDGHEVVVFDDLSKGHAAAVADGAQLVVGGLTDAELLAQTIRSTGTEAVIHMAASSLVGESVTRPAEYYQNNVVAGLTMLRTMLGCAVTRIVFSSTAAVYGEPEKQPIEESDPLAPTNPYGETKLAFERMLAWFGNAYGLRFVSLRYFNAAGATERCGELHDPETHLIPIVLQVGAGRRPEVTVFGSDYPTPDGTCVRDYIHVVDLARAHIASLGLLAERSATFNLGCGGDGYSVREVIEIAREVTGRDIPVKMGPRRAGDPAVLVASSDRIREGLGWAPQRQDLREIVASAWDWLQTHPNGYPEDSSTAGRGE
jgi:UDP-glucose 4-epimerase